MINVAQGESNMLEAIWCMSRCAKLVPSGENKHKHKHILGFSCAYACVYIYDTSVNLARGREQNRPAGLNANFY